jgi:nucleoside-diphosphate-sugar epimerase
VTGNAQQKYNERVNMQPVLVTGATGRVGRAMIAELLGAGVPVRALTGAPSSCR